MPAAGGRTASEALSRARSRRRGIACTRELACGLVLALVSTSSALARDGEASGLGLATRTFLGNPRDVVVIDDTAYVGLDTGLALYDVSDASAPLLVSHVYLPSPALDLAVSGDLVLVANGESGLAVLDASDPMLPVVVGRLATSGTEGVAVLGDVAFLAESSDAATAVYGVRTVDIREPSAPVEIGFVALPNGALDLVVRGTTAFVGMGSDSSLPDHGLVVVDVADPTAPAVEGVLDTGMSVHEVALDGTTAYLATGFPFAGALVAADVTTESSPTTAWRVQLSDAAMGVSVSGGVAHVAARSLGLLAYDVSGASPRLLDALPTGRETWAVAARGDVAFLGERSSNGAASFTAIATPPSPTPIFELASEPYAEATDVAAASGIAYVLRRDALSTYDASVPATLSLLSTWSPPLADLSVLAVEAGLAAIGEEDVVHLVDLSDPDDPEELAQVRLSEGVVVDLELEGGTLYVVDGLGFVTYDVSAPSQPSALGTHRTPAWASAIAVEGSRACVVAGDVLDVVDVSSPALPLLEGWLSVPDQLYAVAIDGDLVVVAGLQTTLATVDLADPKAPFLRGTLAGGPVFDVALGGGRAFVAAGELGVMGVDLSDPSAPLLESWHDTSGTASAVAVAGSAVHVATVDAQHWTLSCDACVAACNATAVVQPASIVECEGVPVTVSGAASQVSGCGGSITYQWYEDGALIAGADGPDLDVPATHAPGTFVLTLEVGCSDDATCTSSADATLQLLPETWPVVTVDSLRVTKRSGIETVSWTIESGSGETNVHRSLDVLEMTDAAITLATVVAVEPGTTHVNAASAPLGDVIFFKVFGRRSCSGTSATP